MDCLNLPCTAPARPAKLAIAGVLAQSFGVRRKATFASLLLRCVLALAVMLNGIALPAAGAAAAGPDMTIHAPHHGHDGMADQSGTGDPPGSPTAYCCDGQTCGCGCTGPQAAALQLSAAPPKWANSPAIPVLVQAPRASSQIGTPFRPPA